MLKRISLLVFVLSSIAILIIFSGPAVQFVKHGLFGPPLPSGRHLTPIYPGTLAIELTLVAEDFNQPVYVAQPKGDENSLFVVEQVGTIRILADGEVAGKPFLNITDRVSTNGWEQGLLSTAFHPNYEQNGRFFVFYTAKPDGRTVVSEFTAEPNSKIVVSQEKIILEVEQPTNQHNGGQLQFGPDGYLYISLGDGNTWDALNNAAQDKMSLLGKILRIDVDSGNPYLVPADNPFADSEAALGEIWALGFRNPWRFSFDRETGDMYVGDVGQVVLEEVNRVVKGGNYGWPIRDGTPCHVKVPDTRINTVKQQIKCNFSSLPNRYIAPTIEYGHTNVSPRGGNAVTGGYVYRGETLEGLKGRYLFADFLTGRIWSYGSRSRLPWETGANRLWEVEELLKTSLLISSFGEGSGGELFLTDRNGGLYQLVEKK